VVVVVVEGETGMKDWDQVVTLQYRLSTFSDIRELLFIFLRYSNGFVIKQEKIFIGSDEREEVKCFHVCNLF
jgi:hypothetical protein